MKEISVHEMKSRLDNGEKLNVIDVREPWEYEEFNIGALNIPLSALTSRLDEIEALKNEEVIVHCKSGIRSAKAAAFMEHAGFKNVINLKGGMDEWQRNF